MLLGINQEKYIKYLPVILSRALSASGSIILVYVLEYTHGLQEVSEITKSMALILGVSVVSRFGTSDILIKKGVEYLRSRDKHSFNVMLLRVTCINSLIYGATLALFATLYLENSFGSAIQWLAISGLNIALVQLCSILKAMNRVSLALALDIGVISVFTAIAILVFENTDYITVVITAFFALHVLFVLIAIIVVRRELKITFSTSNKTLAKVKVLNNIFGFMVVSFVNYFMHWGIFVLLAIALSEIQLGLFTLSYRTAGILTFVLSIMNSILTPRFAHDAAGKNYLKSKSTLKKVSKFLFLYASACSATVVFVLFSFNIFEVYYENFNNSLVLLMLFAGQTVNVTTGPVQALLVMHGKVNFVSKITIINSVIYAVFLYGFVDDVLAASSIVAMFLMFQNLILAIYAYRLNPSRLI